MYQALYRKWRPLTFDEVIGQEHVSRILRNQVINGKLSHAYLFIGSRGTGKTTCARILARAVNCEHPVNGNPCGVCPACREILSGTAPELVEIDAASNNGVDDVRALRDEAIYSPASLKKRVYIIDEVHMLSKSAFNALLKILEEPPEHLLFILATTELNKVPATILSRCQRFSFKRISQESISAYLKQIAGKEKLSLSDDAADMIARLAEGGMRDALSLLDQCSSAEVIDADYVRSAIGLSGSSNVCNLLNHVINGKAREAVELFNLLWNDGKDPANILKELDSLLRDVLVFSTCGNGAEGLLSGSFEFSALKKFSSCLTTSAILGMMENIQKHLTDMRDNSSPRTVAEVCLLSLCNTSTNENSIIPRLEKLEKMLETGEYAPEPGEKQNSSVKLEVTEEAAEKKASESPLPEPEQSQQFPVIPQDEPDDVFSGDTWPDIADVIKNCVPREIACSLKDSNSISGSLEENLLKITAHTDFMYKRLNTTDSIARISGELKRHFGKEYRVIVLSENEERTSPRDINELKKHSIVTFQ